MKIHFITYGDNKFTLSKQRIKQEAEDFGRFDETCIYSPDTLSSNFKETFCDILSMSRGGGYWIWKFDIILQELNKMNDNDILVYLDAGCSILQTGMKRFDEYIEMIRNSEHNFLGFILNGEKESKWTTKQLFDAFKCDIDNSDQIMGGCQMFKKNKRLLEIFDEIIRVLKEDPFLITDEYDQFQQSCFHDNRHDQSIFSIVRKKYGVITLPAYEVDPYYPHPNKSQFPFSAKRIRT